MADLSDKGEEWTPPDPTWVGPVLWSQEPLEFVYEDGLLDFAIGCSRGEFEYINTIGVQRLARAYLQLLQRAMRLRDAEVGISIEVGRIPSAHIHRVEEALR